MEGNYLISSMIGSKLLKVIGFGLAKNLKLCSIIQTVSWFCRKLCMREDGKQQVCIVGLQEYRVSDVEAIREFIEKGNATRSTGTTGANEESSRSHAILQLAIKKSANGSDSKPSRLVGKLSFIDLAGSERGADTTDNDKQTR